MKKQEAELMLAASLETEKTERGRIAADLHDSVSGDLSAIRNYISILSRGDAGDQNLEVFSEIKAGIESALENTRNVSHNLMPPLLDVLGLEAAVKDYLTGIGRKAALNFTVSSSILRELSPSINYHLYRIIQELTTNMLKYNTVKNVAIAFNQKEDYFKIDIIDDGSNYDFWFSLKTSNGSGLRNVSSRLQVINAVIVQQKNAAGNHLIITIPTLIC